MLRTALTARTVMVGLAIALAIGCACGWLVWLGNPGNMGVCGVCFLRDISGALGLFAGAGPKIFRPEIAGILIGAFLWMLISRKYTARSGGHTAARLFFGIWMSIGALVFLGCPFRMLQRIGGGDLNAWIALIGFIPGVGLGLLFEKRGYSSGKTEPAPWPVGLFGVVIGVMLLILFLAGGWLRGPGPGDASGPAHAAWYWALLIVIVVGAGLSATGFCAVSAARQVFTRGGAMLLGAVVLMAGYAAVSVATGKFQFGFDGQPAAHSEWVWNILAMALVGLTGVLAGGCPVRQVVMAGEDNGAAVVTVVGLLLGGALAHNLGLASTGAGTSVEGRWAVIIGLALSVTYGAVMARGGKAQ